jgi:tetratricopeptide (TPR) repeat protein
LKGSRQQEILTELGVVIEDIRAAWDWAVTHQAFEAIELALGSLHHFYWACNRFVEGAEAFEQAAESVQALEEEDSLLLARIWTRLAEFDTWLGRYDQVKALLNQSIEICRTCQAQKELGIALAALGILNYWLGDYAASRECSQESLSIFRQLGEKYWIANTLNHLAVLICDETADLERARPLYEESLALAREVGDQIGEARILLNQGATAYELEDYAEAQRLYGESLELYRALDYHRGISAVLNNLGLVASAQGDYGAARELIHESLDIKRETGHRGAVVHALMEMGNVTRRMGEYRESSRWYREALTLAWEIQALHMVRYVIVGVAELLDRQGEQERALELLCFVQRQDVEEQLLVDRVNDLVAKLEGTLSPTMVTKCHEHGQAMTLEAVVQQCPF